MYIFPWIQNSKTEYQIPNRVEQTAAPANCVLNPSLMICAESLAILEAGCLISSSGQREESEHGGEEEQSEHGGEEEDDDGLAHVAPNTSFDSSCSSNSETASSSKVGKPRNASSHSKGHRVAIKSVEKWVYAALAFLKRRKEDLILLPSHAPNDALASEIHGVLSDWFVTGTLAKDAGVVDTRSSILDRGAPTEVLVKARSWMLDYITTHRSALHLSDLDDNWGRKLAGRRSDAREVNSAKRKRDTKSGKIYRSKHDMSPTQEQLTSMTFAGFIGDQRVAALLLDSIEGPMSIGFYLATGARGSELKKMHIQSLGYEEVQHKKSGLIFPILKLTAHETKTKRFHLNQMIADSNPHSCAVGLFGCSLLVRVKLYGSPPFGMETDSQSWMILGTSVTTLDTRIKTTFAVSGVRRQTGDVVTYIGRQFGSRMFQHQGGSTEGGAARRGHGDKTAAHHYTEVPLPDLLTVGNNDRDNPFTAAHLMSSLYEFADAVLLIAFPDIARRQLELDSRQREVDCMRGDIAKIRSDEKLLDKQKLLNAIRFVCRTAVCCLVARPRGWKRWAILEDQPTLWQRAAEPSHRLILFLFGGNRDALEAMSRLAVEVRRCECAEIEARKASPDNAIATATVDAIRNSEQRATEREERMNQQNQAMFQQLMIAVRQGSPPLSTQLPPPLPRPEQVATVLLSPPVLATPSVPLEGLRVKHSRQAQTEVVYFSQWSVMGEALDYAKSVLAPLEKEQGHVWRNLKFADGRKDGSRTKQWRNYRALAISVGILQRKGCTYDQAVATVQSRFDSFGDKAHTPLLKEIEAQVKDMNNAETISKEVLCY